MDQNTWILVARSDKAKLLAFDQGSRSLRLIREFDNIEARLSTAELTPDRQGRSYSSSKQGAMPQTLQPPTDPKEHIKDEFARSLADEIELGIAKNLCDSVVLVAEPGCLGRIRAEIAPKIQAKVKKSINKDLYLLKDKELLTRIEEHS